MERLQHAQGELIEMIFDPEVKAILHHLSELFAVRAVLFDPSGKEVHSGGDKANCEFCQLIQTNLDQYKKCRAFDVQQQQLAAESTDLVPYLCHAGVNEAMMAVYDHDTLLGYIFIGQYRSTDKPAEHLRQAWFDKFNNNEIDETFAQIPYLDKKQMQHLQDLFASLVRLIVNQRLIGVSERNPLQVLITRMRHNPEEALSLPMAAAILGKSTSTVSHLFTQYYQCGFKQVQLRIRIERACYILENEPDLRVLDIAGRLGFSDPLYFSRQFKKYVHLSPKAYRASLGT